jgi:dienelactone hydrolase
MSRTLVAVAVVVMALAQGQANAQVARVEYHPFNSITLSDAEFLTGKEGRPVTLAGELRIPRAGQEKLAAVILLPGGGGMGGAGGMIDEWSRELNQIGVATFAIDSFSGRGLVSAFGGKVGRLAMVFDSYRALELLARHPQIDSGRVAVMGFSLGGIAALRASVTRFQKMHGPQNLQFAAHVAFYPGCDTTFRSGDDVGDKPIRILHGTADDSFPIGPCREYAERLAKAGRDVRLIEYPGAHHVFDAPAYREQRVLSAPTVANWSRATKVRSSIALPSSHSVSAMPREGRAPDHRDRPCRRAGSGSHPHRKDQRTVFV